MYTRIILGAVAGGAGVWAMDRVGWLMYRREDSEAVEQEGEARAEELDPAHAMANKIAGLVGVKLSPPQPHPAGIAVHYGLGVVPAIVLVSLIHKHPWLGLGQGAFYGFILFALNDEIMAPMLGIASGPTKYPWQAHARGLASHLVLGVVTVSTYRVLRRVF